MAKQQKNCFIVRRYFIKASGRVCCVVRNGENKEYNVCVHSNGQTSCTQAANGEPCPSSAGKHQCYHVKHVLEQEAARQPRQVEMPVEAPVSTQTVISKAEQAPTRGNIAFGAYSFTSGLAQVQQARNERRARERRESAALNGNRGFSLMR